MFFMAAAQKRLEVFEICEILVQLQGRTVGYVHTIKMLNEEIDKIRSSEIWCCWCIGQMREVMTSSVTFVCNSIQCLYLPSVLCIQVSVTARILAKWVVEITHFEG